MKKLNNKGFGIAGLVIVIVVVGLIGAVGWLVYDRQNNSKNSENSVAQSESNKSESTTDTNLKTFSDEKAGVSFEYPNDWTVQNNMEDYEGMGYGGEVVVTSPEGLKVYINPNFGGKGGDCVPNPSDKPHSTENCSTLEVLSKEKTNIKANIYETDSNSSEEVYIVRIKYTRGNSSTNTEQKTVYNSYLTNNRYTHESTGPMIGAFYGTGTITLEPVTNSDYSNIDTYLESDKLSDQSYLDSAEVKQAEEIYKSLKF